MAVGFILVGALCVGIQSLHADEFDALIVDTDLTAWGSGTLGLNLTVAGNVSVVGLSVGGDLYSGGAVMSGNFIQVGYVGPDYNDFELNIGPVEPYGGDPHTDIEGNHVFTSDQDGNWLWAQNGLSLDPQMYLSGPSLTIYSPGGDYITIDTDTQEFDSSSGNLTFYSTGNLSQMTITDDAVLSLIGYSRSVAFDPGNQTLQFDGNLGFQESSGKFIMSGNILDGGSPNITFDPANLNITFSSGLILSGNNATHLTISSGTTGFAYGIATAGGDNSVAMGGYANATNDYAVALANGNASGEQSLAAANSTTSGNQSAAFANGTAAGDYSLAMGNNSLANATNAMALGTNTSANAAGAIALGTNVTASTWDSVTVGHYNEDISGNSTTWVATDPAFIVGIGNSTTPANGLIILNNGDAIINGNATLPGNTTIGGNATTSKISGNVIISQPQGDVSIGIFGN